MKKKHAIIISLVFVLCLSLLGCGSGQTTGTVVVEEDFKNRILFNGSSTLAPVISQIAKDFGEEYGTWNNVKGDFPEEDIYIYVSSGGSGFGVKSAIEGAADFGMVAREVKDTEKEKMSDYQEFRVGIDALTIAVNPENPIWQLRDTLTTEEIQKIFAGEIKTWNELDENLPNREIVLLIRDLGGGASQVFQSAVMGDKEVSVNAIQSPSMGALVAKIIENKDAIGYASFGLVNVNEGKLIPLPVDGVDPTEENIVSGEYKISRPLIIAKDGALTDSEEAFIQYIKSEKGLQTIEDFGFVPVK